MSKVSNVLTMIEFLSTGRKYTISELSKKLEVTPRMRECKFVDCLTFFDGEEYYTFYGVNEGTLSYSKKGDYKRRAKSNLWYLFIPKNCNKTLAEMTDEERNNRKDDRTSATEIFIEWYVNEYLKEKKLKLK